MVIDPASVDWTELTLSSVVACAADGIPEALAELERRLA